MGLIDYVLDTSAYSAFRRGLPGVVARVQRARSLIVPTIALGELRYGFRGGGRERENEEELLEFLSSGRVRVAAVTESTSHRYAQIRDALRRNGTPLPTNDIWISAVTMEQGATVLSLDRHFLQVPQILAEIL